MSFRLPELLILFVVALLIFGPKKLPEMGSAIGRSLTAFRRGWQEISGDHTEDALLMERRAELKRLELEALEREIAAKRAALVNDALPAPSTVVDDVPDAPTTVSPSDQEAAAFSQMITSRSEDNADETPNRTMDATPNETVTPPVEPPTDAIGPSQSETTVTVANDETEALAPAETTASEKTDNPTEAPVKTDLAENTQDKSANEQAGLAR